MKYDITVGNTTENLERLVDSVYHNFSAVAALQFCQCLVQGNVATPIGRCFYKDIYAVALDVLSKYFYDVECNAPDDSETWSLFQEAESMAEAYSLYGVGNSIHLWAGYRNTEKMLRYILNEMADEKNEERKACYATIVWATIKVCDIDPIALADELRHDNIRREVLRRVPFNSDNMCKLALDASNAGNVHPSIEINGLNIILPPIFTINCALQMLVSTVAEYL